MIKVRQKFNSELLVHILVKPIVTLMNKLAPALFYSSLLLMAAQVNAQKLPNVQTESLRAPATIKIDGKATEWDNKFQASNKTTDLQYTLANDNNNLYLVIQATDYYIIQKVIMGGLTLTINADGKRDVKNAAAITFPVYESGNPGGYFMFTKSAEKMASNLDSLMKLHNNKITDRAKFIGIDNIEGVTDSMLPIYNEPGIKAAALLDRLLNYTCELAIPLKHLKLGKNAKFAYNIKLNAGSIDGYKIEIKTLRPDMVRAVRGSANGTTWMLGGDPQDLSLAATTDFWGEYTLAK